MFDHDPGAWRQGDAVEKVGENRGDHLFSIGRIHENQIEALIHRLEAVQIFQDIPANDPRPPLDAAGPNIPLDHGRGIAMIVYKNDGASPPAQGLQTQGAGSGKQIQNPRVLNADGQDVEYRLPAPIRGGPNADTLDGLQFSPSKFSRDNPHVRPRICIEWFSNSNHQPLNLEPESSLLNGIPK